MRLITFDLFQASENLWITFISSINIRCHLVAGKGNSMAFLIHCRHWFPHISGERRLNREWRSGKRQSGHTALQVAPRDPRAHVCTDCTPISQPLQPLPERPLARSMHLSLLVQKSTWIPHAPAEIGQFYFLCFKGLSNPEDWGGKTWFSKSGPTPAASA